MAYCRINGEDSDVYLIGTAYKGEAYLECFGAGWKEADNNIAAGHIESWVDSYDVGMKKTGKKHQFVSSFTTTSISAMVAHLKEHEKVGHMVPQRVYDELHSDTFDSYNGDTYRIPNL